MGMYETVVYSEDSSSSDRLRSITEATTDFMDWLSGSSKDNHEDDVPSPSRTQRRHTTAAANEASRRSTAISSSRSKSCISSNSTRSGERSSSSSSSSSQRRSSSHPQSNSSRPRSSAELLSFTKEEVASIVESQVTFRELQKALRNKGCVTNGYLKENMHHYVYHLKQLQASQRRQQRRRRTTTKQYNDMPATTPMTHQIHPNQPSSIAA